MSEDSPALEFVLEIRASIAPTVEISARAGTVRRTVPITGGLFAGPLLSGSVLPGGADWQIIEPDGLSHIDARYVLQTDDGTCIEVRNQGLRHGPAEVMKRLAAGEDVSSAEYYFRTAPRFFAPDGRYDWLNRALFIASGERYREVVVIRVWKIL